MTDEFLPFALPDIGPAEIEAVTEVLQSGWITTGPKSMAFEQAFAREVGAQHAIAVNSCTAALHLALDALQIRADDEVIVPTLTFAASAEVVVYTGATPVLVDVKRDDNCIDPEAIRRAITPRTRAIMPVHFAGAACDMSAIMDIAREHNLAVVEDAAHAFPCTFEGRPIGTLGDVTCFSFYATKTITTAEGGMATTQRSDLAERMRIMSLHGISKDAWKRYSAEGSWYYEIEAPGFKYNMPDIAAALGLAQLRRAEKMRRVRGEIAETYRRSFKQEPAIELLTERSGDLHSHHLFVIRLVKGSLKIDRSEFIQQLKARGIGSSVHFIPLHAHPYYRRRFGHHHGAFPVAWDNYQRSLSLPIYSRMTRTDTARVADAVLEICRSHRR